MAKTTREGRRVWRRRFVEVDTGSLRLFKTGPPTNIEVAALSRPELRLRFGDEGLELQLWAQEALKVQLASQRAGKIRSVADKIAGRLLGDQDTTNFMTTVKNSQNEGIV